MKIICVLLFIAFGKIAHAQDFSNTFMAGYSFPLGSKFTIKLNPIDSVNYNFSVVKFEMFQTTVNTDSLEVLFDKVGNDSTIVCYFVVGTSGNTDEEKQKNRRIVLILKNYTSMSFGYSSDIQQKEGGEFTPTSNVGTYSGAIQMEIWPYMISYIGLRNFKKMN